MVRVMNAPDVVSSWLPPCVGGYSFRFDTVRKGGAQARPVDAGAAAAEP
jgi:hypothetical protein